MKARNVAIILDNMTSFGFWLFMKKPILKRYMILRQIINRKKS